MTKIHPAIAGHAMEENERLRGLLRELREITSEYAWDADLEARVDAALSRQADPADTFTAVDMATAAAQGFRDGQAAVEQAAAQDDQEVAAVIGFYEGEREPRLLSWNVLPNGEHRLYTRPAQTEQQPIVVPEDFQPLETIRWWISTYTNPENGPSYQGHGRIMLSSRAQQWPTAYPHEAMDKLATDRYRVGSAGAGTLHRYAVRAGDGEQELYRGSESDCQNVARKLAGAFLDGGLTAFGLYAAPHRADRPAEVEGAVEMGSDAWMALHLLDRLDVSADEEPRVQQVEEIVRRMGAALSAVTAERDRLADMLSGEIEENIKLREQWHQLSEENDDLRLQRSGMEMEIDQLRAEVEGLQAMAQRANTLLRQIADSGYDDGSIDALTCWLEEHPGAKLFARVSTMAAKEGV
ncbi:hypothetical protein ACYCFC_05500 [Stutzerimonas sp. NM35]